MLTSEKWGGRVPLVLHRSTPILCKTSQSNILVNKFVITQMGISYTKCRNPPLLPYAISIKQARGESAKQFHHLQCGWSLEPINNVNTRLQTDRARQPHSPAW